MTEKYQAPSVKKAFQILKLISDADRGVGISELAKSLGISKSTVHGITSAMEEIGIISRNPLNKRYNLGYTMVELCKNGLSRLPLRVVARRHLEVLREETGETVFIGIPKDGQILIIDVVEGKTELKITSPSGTMLPLNAGAPGKVFLAHMEEKKALKYLMNNELVKYTKNTIIGIDTYFQELREVRKRGYATDYEEYRQGVKAIAALIKTSTPPLAAIWMVGFSFSLTEERMKHGIERALKAAEAIAQDLQKKG